MSAVVSESANDRRFPGVRLRHRRRCASCGAFLAHDNHDSICSPCASNKEYNPYHDPDLAKHIIRVLELYGREQPVNVWRALGCSDESKRNAVSHEVHHLRRAGYGILGVRGRGYMLESEV